MALDKGQANEPFRKSRIRKHDLIYCAVLLGIWLAVSVPRLQGPIDLRWDASTYYVLGTALAEGKGYRLLNEPGEIQAVQYPPLVPALVAVSQRLMRTNDFFKVGCRLRIVYFVFSGAYLLAAYALARQLLIPLHASIISAITALSFNSFFYPSDSLYADLPFALVSTLFLLCQSKRNQTGWEIASGLLGVVAYLLRTAGIALLATWVAESLLRRRFLQAAIRGAISAIPILAWQAHIWQITRSDAYLRPAYAYQRAPYYYSNVTYGENSVLVDPFRPEFGRSDGRDLFSRLMRNAAAIPVGLGESSWFDREFGLSLWVKLHERLAVPLEYHWRPRVSRALCLALLSFGVLALAGTLLAASGKRWFLSLYFALAIALVMLTPWQSQFSRYLAPLTPIALIFVVVALLAIQRWFARGNAGWQTAGKALPIAFLIGVLLVQIPVAFIILRDLRPVSYFDAAGREQLLRLLTYETHWHALDHAFEWVRRSAPPDGIVATSVPHLAYLRTGHKAVLPPLEADSNEAARLLDEVPVSYLIVDELGRPPISDYYAAPIVAHRPEDWTLVYTTPTGGTKVYERIR